jgi:hypothetical protein
MMIKLSFFLLPTQGGYRVKELLWPYSPCTSNFLFSNTAIRYICFCEHSGSIPSVYVFSRSLALIFLYLFLQAFCSWLFTSVPLTLSLRGN